jgi:hypothetical protein
MSKTSKEKEEGNGSPLHYFCKENKPRPVKLNQSQSNIKTAKKKKKFKILFAYHFHYFISYAHYDKSCNRFVGHNNRK